MFKKILYLFAAMFMFSIFVAADLEVIKEISGLSFPESFIYDQESDCFFISNLGPKGGADGMDNDGYITKLSGDFSKRNDKWISGWNGIVLNAPKGLAVHSGILYVSDIDHLKGFNIKSGKQIIDIDLSVMGAGFLNDVAVDDSGNIYVTCTGTGMIFRYSTLMKKTDVWMKKRKIAGPNGIVFTPDKNFIVLSYADGAVFQVDSSGKKMIRIAEGYTSLDGVDYDNNGNLYFSSYTRGKIWLKLKSGDTRIIYEIDSSPADISVDRVHGYLLVPVMMDNKAVVLNLKNQ